MADEQTDQCGLRSGLLRPLGDVLAIGGNPVKMRRDPVADDVLVPCLDAAAAAATGRRPRCELVVVRDPDVKHQLARIYRQGWGVYKRILARRGAPVEERQWEADHFEEVPVVVVGCAQGRRPMVLAVGAARFYGAVLPAMQNLLLAARAQGLAASLSSLPVWSLWQTRRTLQLPAAITPIALATLGWPSTALPAAELVHGIDLAALDHHGRPFPAVR